MIHKRYVFLAALGLAQPANAQVSCEFILQHGASDRAISTRYEELLKGFCDQGNLDAFRQYVSEMEDVGTAPPDFLLALEFSSEADFRLWKQGFCKRPSTLEPLEHYSQPVINAWKACMASAESDVQTSLDKIEKNVTTAAMSDAAGTLKKSISVEDEAATQKAIVEINNATHSLDASRSPAFICMGDYYNCAAIYGQYRCAPTYVFCLTDVLLP